MTETAADTVMDVKVDQTTETTDILPNQTIYVNNINEKLSQKKLKEQLYGLFSKYGTILEIISSKRQKMKGQAFIVFQDITAASNALREMNGFSFFDRNINVQYSKNKSDAVSKLDGTYVEKKRERETEQEKRKAKKQDNKKSTKQSKTTSTSTPSGNVAPREAPPNRILFVENLPDNCQEMMIQMLFSQFPGFQSVNMTTARKGVAFVEYDDDIKSGLAMSHLQGFKVTSDRPMVISFAAQ
ncbi:U2 small nuclear ribonucleoprotein B [Cavenderia fasciculata]|uniref:U2 small nuclear ribonucleoprotein B n=1 Tax=Cavenderia fasciculata TaxID=261658 RepID=F4Q2X8_CACFS|nr:U2 small nuclear ribonucleoprotein B [Cavenderia fasciculata]EGG17542.1 U2 small nuclear ribonucleoprotein B [Cavenderia fasciculata]|eukprot:XP_004356026.1 U2 small nuclear ribonucleoprotein B [Cavenderia fasciculata]